MYGHANTEEIQRVRSIEKLAEDENCPTETLMRLGELGPRPAWSRDQKVSYSIGRLS